MIFSIDNTADGYVVSAFIRDATGYGQWLPLRNFGDRQGDAKDFCWLDCPRLTSSQIKQLVARYDKSFVYMRVNGSRFIRQTITQK